MKPITEYYSTRQDGTILVITKPINNCMIRQIETGGLLDVAYDIGYYGYDNEYHPTKYHYVETDIKIKNINLERN